MATQNPFLLKSYLYIMIFSLLLAGCEDKDTGNHPPNLKKSVFRIKPDVNIGRTYIIDRFEKDGELVYDSNHNESKHVVRMETWRNCRISWGLRIKNTPNVHWLVNLALCDDQFTLPNKLPPELQTIKGKEEKKTGTQN